MEVINSLWKMLVTNSEYGHTHESRELKKSPSNQLIWDLFLPLVLHTHSVFKSKFIFFCIDTLLLSNLPPYTTYNIWIYLLILYWSQIQSKRSKWVKYNGLVLGQKYSTSTIYHIHYTLHTCTFLTCSQFSYIIYLLSIQEASK